MDSDKSGGIESGWVPTAGDDLYEAFWEAPGLDAEARNVVVGRAAPPSESVGAGVGYVATGPSAVVAIEDAVEVMRASIKEMYARMQADAKAPPRDDLAKLQESISERVDRSLCFVRGMLYSGDVPDRDMLAAVSVYATELGDNYIDAGLQLTDGWGGSFHLDIGCRPQDVRRHIAAVGTIMSALKELQDALVRVAQRRPYEAPAVVAEFDAAELGRVADGEVLADD